MGRVGMPCCQVAFGSVSSVAVGDGVRKSVSFPQDGLGLQTGWQQAASMYSALL